MPFQMAQCCKHHQSVHYAYKYLANGERKKTLTPSVTLLCLRSSYSKRLVLVLNQHMPPALSIACVCLMLNSSEDNNSVIQNGTHNPLGNNFWEKIILQSITHLIDFIGIFLLHSLSLSLLLYSVIHSIESMKNELFGFPFPNPSTMMILFRFCTVHFSRWVTNIVKIQFGHDFIYLNSINLHIQFVCINFNFKSLLRKHQLYVFFGFLPDGWHCNGLKSIFKWRQIWEMEVWGENRIWNRNENGNEAKWIEMEMETHRGRE